MDRKALDLILAERAAGRIVVSLVDTESGRTIIHRAGTPFDGDEALAEVFKDAIAADKPSLIEAGGRTYFVNVFSPPLRLIIIGAVHIAQALAPMADIAGYEVTIIDPREAFAEQSRFGAFRVLTEWPDEALKRLEINTRTALVTLTHDPKLDDAALLPALASDAFYIGALGSKKTQLARRNRLERAGLKADVIDRIHGPVGLSIEARTPAEIAIAILAEMTSLLRKARG